jgi:type I restriction enzyme S subunit
MDGSVGLTVSLFGHQVDVIHVAWSGICAPYRVKKLEEIAGGAVMPNLSDTDSGNSSFYLPPLDRQIEIVEQVDCLHAETQRLTRLYERKLAALEELKKSILHQAFSGEL